MRYSQSHYHVSGRSICRMGFPGSDDMIEMYFFLQWPYQKVHEYRFFEMTHLKITIVSIFSLIQCYD